MKENYYPRLIAAWVVMNVYIALLISAIVNGSAGQAPSLPVLFVLVFIISGMATTVGHTLCRLNFSSFRVPVNLVAVLLTTRLALLICDLLIPLLFDSYIAEISGRFLVNMTPSIYLITSLLALAGIYIESLRKKSMAAESTAQSPTEPVPNTESQGSAEIEESAPALERRVSHLVLKECENLHRLDLDEIVYLSSHGHRTTIHTREDSLVVARLLKEIQNALPDDGFVRIHKQYIINSSYLIRLRHERAGQYRAFLSDDDATGLPVGRSYLPLLRRRFPA